MIELYPYTSLTSIGCPEAAFPVGDADLPIVDSQLSVTTEQQPEALDKPHRLRKWAARLGIAGAVLLSGTVAEVDISGLPGHSQVELAYELGLSDTKTVLHNDLGQQPDLYLAGDQSVQPQLLNYLQNNFVGDNNLFLSSSDIFKRTYASTWGSAWALNAEDIISLIPGPSEDKAATSFNINLNSVNKYYWVRPPGSMPGYDANIAPYTSQTSPRMMDDEEWMAIEDMQSPAGLKYAEQVFNLGLSQMDKTNGGIYWVTQTANESNHSRNLVSNAPFVMLATELYHKTHKIKYLKAAVEINNWDESQLCDQSDHMCADHINPNGSLDSKIWTYGQGVMAGAEAAVGNLQGGVQRIEYDIAYFQAHHLYGHPGFDEFFFKNALWLAGLDDLPSFTATIQKALHEAIKCEPQDPSDILDAAGDAGLYAEAALPTYKYKYLFFGTTAVHPVLHIVL